MTQAELIEYAYNLFPRNISFAEDEISYLKTAEYNRLLGSLEELTKKKPQWAALLMAIEQAPFFTEELGIEEEHQRCFQIRIRSGNDYINLSLSAITPLYFFYSMDSLDLMFGNVHYAFTDHLTESNLKLIGEIDLIVKKFFPTYEQINTETLNYELTDIRFLDLGNPNIPNSFFTPMTLFNAFFSSTVFY